jgi:hypothetical protein
LSRRRPTVTQTQRSAIGGSLSLGGVGAAPSRRCGAGSTAAIAPGRRSHHFALANSSASSKGTRGLAGVWEPRPRGDAALDRQPPSRRGGAPTTWRLQTAVPAQRAPEAWQGVGAAPSRRCGAGSTAAIAPGRRSHHLALANSSASSKGARGLAGVWEPRPRGDAALDRQPPSRRGGAPTTWRLQTAVPAQRAPEAWQGVGAAPSRRCGAGSTAAIAPGRRSHHFALANSSASSKGARGLAGVWEPRPRGDAAADQARWLCRPKNWVIAVIRACG